MRKRKKKKERKSHLCLSLSRLNIPMTFRTGFIVMVSSPLPTRVVVLLSQSHSPHRWRQQPISIPPTGSTATAPPLLPYTIALKQLKTVLAFFGSLIILLPYELSFYKSSFNITLLHSKFMSKYLIRKTDAYLMTLRGNLPKSLFLYPKIHESDSPNV